MSRFMTLELFLEVKYMAEKRLVRITYVFEYLLMQVKSAEELIA